MSRPAIPDGCKDEVLHLCLAGYTDNQLAARFNCSRLAVMEYRVEHGIVKKRGGNWHRKAVDEPVTVYFDPSINHLVKVYAPREASGDIPTDEEAHNGI